MILIQIAVTGGTPSSEVVSAIRRITGWPIAKIVEAIRSEEPIYEKDFLARPRETVFAEMRQLLDVIEECFLRLRVSENGREISAEILRNMMRSSEESARHLRELDELGHS